jgi:FMN-dependent NADH-azoreductase
MKLFRLDTSIRIDGSISRAVTDTLVNELTAREPGLTVTRRDIGTTPLPSVWADAVAASRTPEGTVPTPDQSAAQALAGQLAGEIADADAIVVAVPLYNFGVPNQLKLWIDLLITDPRFAPGAPAAIAGKPVTLVIARGGGYGEGTPRDGWDHSTAYLRRIFGDVWGGEVTVIEAELTLADVVEAMAPFRPLAKENLANAHALATQHGRHVAESVLVSSGA